MPLDPAASDPNDELGGLTAGQRVGRYTLVAQLASGGMAHVWTAEPDNGSGLARTVAVKIIRSELAHDKDYARMFVDEATIATSIEHPNVCQTYELDQHDGLMYMAMEWVPGESLGGMLRAGDRFSALDPAIAARICADACAGLHAAHDALDDAGNSLGVIHRDVSPPNILISLQGQVKVSDFGIAKARHQLHDRTKTGEVKGKFGYLAPEQITGTGGDRRIDIYAMGCVLYVATTGMRPFGNGPKAMTKILLGEYRKPSELDPNYPPGLEAVVVKALSHEPRDRFQTAGEMREALERWLVDVRRVVTASDVARVLVERMPPEALDAVRKLQNRRRGKGTTFSALLETFDALEPPTAASGLVAPPSDLERVARETPSLEPEELLDAVEERIPAEAEGDDGPTIRTASRFEETVRETRQEDRSGGRASEGAQGRVDVSLAATTLPPNRPRPGPTEPRGRIATESGRTRPDQRAKTSFETPQAKHQTRKADMAIIWQAALAGVAFALFAWLFLK